MAGVTATPTRCSEALAELERLLEPHLWITDLHWEGGLVDVATVTGWAKPQGMPADGLRDGPVGEHEPAEIRAAMVASAQESIRLAEEAGYRHAKHPVFEIDGTAQRDGERTILRTKAVLRLTLRPPKREAL